MTEESAKLTEPWIQRHEAGYAYAYDKGGKLKRFFGVRGIPHAVLVDPNGVVVWRGHPASLTGSTIEEHLAGALTFPLYAWPSSASSVGKVLAKGELGLALDKARKLEESEEHARVLKEVEGLVEGRLAATEAALEKGDFLGALETAKELGHKLKKEALATERMQRVLDAIDGNEDAKALIAVQEKIAKLRKQDPTKRKQVDKALEDLREIMREHPDTFAASQASAYRIELQKRRSK